MSIRIGAAATLVAAVLLAGCNQTGKDPSVSATPTPAAPSAAGPELASQRDVARLAAQSGKFAEALAIYDRLTDSGSTDVGLYQEAREAARAASDQNRNLLYAERRLKFPPEDWAARSALPLLYRRSGDMAGFERSRADLIARWKASSDPQIKRYSFVFVDAFAVAGLGINAIECMEQAGPLGVGYQFTVLVPPNQPRPLIKSDYRAVIVLEHNKMTGQIMRESGLGDGPKPSLDVFTPGGHRTIGFLDKEPTYDELKVMVARDVAAHAAEWLSPTAGSPAHLTFCTTKAEAG